MFLYSQNKNAQVRNNYLEFVLRRHSCKILLYSKMQILTSISTYRYQAQLCKKPRNIKQSSNFLFIPAHQRFTLEVFEHRMI